ncbi:SDR family NAD(P)-dependent oxidoreductase [Brevibacillus massiliensis]|uniref:SDR family NAD(P)-dependent oxidoreductase n=1 Tax=Brevibacillus massiliensis TaxID=1118054 RepID=UPI0002EC622F|nr:SDR family NAD(P)-dependent oxidoreductase [Brevibacillus massiliensis]
MIAKSLQDQVAVVTGGSSGIGHAIVKELCKAGMKVAIVDIDKKKAEDSIKETQWRERAAVMETDLFHTSSLSQVVEFADEKFGRIDLLVNCAGIYPSNPVLQVNEEATAAVMPRPGISHYAASKAGLVMLTRVFALEWAEFGIRVLRFVPRSRDRYLALLFNNREITTGAPRKNIQGPPIEGGIAG